MPEKITLMNAPGDKALDKAIVTRMEMAFGLDLSQVKPQGGTSQASARAYVSGNDVFFAPGVYSLNTSDGQALLGYELAHVKQQTAAPR
jgi:Domain of unknown function (DUF4157)